MTRINPNLIAAGIGAVVGGNTMSTDGDLLDLATGATIGASIGGLGNWTIPSNVKNFTFNRKQAMLNDAISEGALTLNQRKENLLLIGEEKGKFLGNNKFDPIKPFDSINNSSFEEFKNYVNNIQSNEELIRVESSLKSNLDLHVKPANSLKTINSQSTTAFRIAESASLSQKKIAFSSYLEKRLGYSKNLAQAKSELFTSIFERSQGMISITDGKMSVSGIGDIKLTQRVKGADGNIADVYIHNGNMEVSNKVNPFGHSKITGTSTKVVADALGIQMGDAFNLHALTTELVEGVKGLKPEDAIALLAKNKNLTPEQLKDAVQKITQGSYQYDADGSMSVKQNRIDGSPLHVSQNSSLISNTIDHSLTVEVDNTGFKNFNGSVLRGMRSQSGGKHQPAELRKLNRFYSKLGDFKSYVKADANFKFLNSDLSTTDALTLHAPIERSAYSVNNRQFTANFKGSPSQRVYNDYLNHIKQTTGRGNVHLASAIALPTLDISANQELKDNLSKLFTGNTTLGDGFVLANKSFTENITHEGLSHVYLKSNSSGEYSTPSVAFQKLIEGELGVDSIRELASNHSALEEAIGSETQKEIRKTIELNRAVYQSKFKSREDQYQSKFKYLSSQGLLDNTLSYENAIKNNNFKDHLDELFNTVIADRNEQSIFNINQMPDELKTEKESLMYLLSEGHKRGDASKKLDEAFKVFDTKLEVSKSAVKLTNPKPNSVLAYNPDGTAEQITSAYSNHELEDIQKIISRDPQGNIIDEKIEISYKANSNLGDYITVKSYGTSSKDQMLNTSAGDFGMYGSLAENKELWQLSSKEATDKKGKKHTFYNVEFTHSDGTIKEYPSEYFKNLINPNNSWDDLDDNLEKIRKRASEISENYAIITDDDSVGLSARNKIANDLIENNKPSMIKDTERADFLLQYTQDRFKQIDSLSIDDEAKAIQKSKIATGVANFTVAMSNEKASIPLYFTQLYHADRAYSYQVGSYTQAIKEAGSSSEEGLKGAQSFIDSVSPGKYKLSGNSSDINLLESFEKDFSSFRSSVQTMFTSKESIYHSSKDPSLLSRGLDYFILGQQHSPDSNIFISLSSFNRNIKAEAGSGSGFKGMSWNAQTQLLSNGFTHSELDMFASFNKEALADIQGVTGLIKTHEDAINSQLNEKNIQGFLNTFERTPSTRSSHIESLGLSRSKNLVDFYNLNYSENKQGFKAIPIFYENTKMFGSYFNSEGVETNSGTSKMFKRILELDNQLTSVSSERSAFIKAQLDQELEALSKVVSKSTSGSSNILKTALTREAERSTYTNVNPISGEFSEFVERSNKSYAALSVDGAMDRLKRIGVDIKSRKQFLNEFTESIEGTQNLRRIKTGMNDQYLFGLLSREPAQGPGSIRHTEFILDTSIAKGTQNSVFIKNDDLLYKLFQFGDYDVDHTTEYFPDFQNSTKESLDNIRLKGERVNQELLEVAEIAKTLGVKGKKDYINSYLDILPDAKNAGTKIESYEDWHQSLLKSLYMSSEKGGARKVLSPTVTKLAAAMNNSITSAVDASHPDSVMARVLTHYTVENLLKAQHMTNDAFEEGTAADRLTALRKPSTLDQYIKELDTTLSNTIESLKNNNPEAYERVARAKNLILSSERSFVTQNPINPMDLKSKSSVREEIEELNNVFNGNNGSISVMPTEVSDELEVAKSVKSGYNTLKQGVMHNINSNKKVLGVGLGTFAGLALLTQNKPDFGNSKARADLGGYVLAPSQSAAEDTAQTSEENMNRSLMRPVEYVKSYSKGQGFQSAYVAANTIGQVGTSDFNRNVNSAIFGNQSMNNARVEYVN